MITIRRRRNSIIRRTNHNNKNNHHIKNNDKKKKKRKNHQTQYHKNSLEKRGNIFRIGEGTEEFAAGMRQALLKEWNKFLTLRAVKLISEEEAQAFIAEGGKCIPLQWIVTDKNEHIRRPSGPGVEPLYKARLVARGDLEKGYSRTDSPTADQEALFIVCSVASSHRLPIRSGDVENAYFQGEKSTRTLLRSQTRGRIPDDNVSLTDFLLALVPIYGTKDAGRNFWKRLHSVMCDCGLESNHIFKACYSYARNGKVLLISPTHVDDLICACKPTAEYIIARIKSLFILGTEDVYIFRYCGKEVTQDLGIFSITMTCGATSEKLSELKLPVGRPKNLAAEL